MPKSRAAPRQGVGWRQGAYRWRFHRGPVQFSGRLDQANRSPASDPRSVVVALSRGRWVVKSLGQGRRGVGPWGVGPWGVGCRTAATVGPLEDGPPDVLPSVVEAPRRHVRGPRGVVAPARALGHGSRPAPGSGRWVAFGAQARAAARPSHPWRIGGRRACHLAGEDPEQRPQTRARAVGGGGGGEKIFRCWVGDL